jgi:diguanylate cyclase (GGDEF)-like protein
VLTTIGQKIKNSELRERDMPGRYGGEEFLVILPGSDLNQAAEVAERIRNNIATHLFAYEQSVIPVTVSLGVATLNKDHATATDLYKAADKALYESKHTGKNKVTLAPQPA